MKRHASATAVHALREPGLCFWPCATLPYSWLIQAARVTGISSKIKTVPTPPQSCVKTRAELFRTPPGKRNPTRSWPPSNPGCWGLRCGPPPSTPAHSSTFSSPLPQQQPPTRLLPSCGPWRTLCVPSVSHASRLRDGDISPQWGRAGQGFVWGFVLGMRARTAWWNISTRCRHLFLPWGWCSTSGQGTEGAAAFQDYSKSCLWAWNFLFAILVNNSLFQKSCFVVLQESSSTGSSAAP